MALCRGVSVLLLLLLVGSRASHVISLESNRSAAVQLPYSRLAFSKAASSRAIERRSENPSRRRYHDRSEGYLIKSILKDRVPQGWNTFVAHQYTVSDPLHHFSVLPPARGCGTLDVPGDTADTFGGCDVATNGGFFIPGDDVVDHNCIGPIVSDGYLRHDDYRQNVLFGIEAPREGDGNVTFFVGYLSEEEYRKRRWLQLISGCVWLVRDGMPYVEQSLAYEDFTAQRSGSGRTFIDLRAPRLALGITASGNLLLVAIDGSEPDWEGLPLPDVAKVMIGLGAVQAVNLDGGGSVSVYEDDQVVNIPSDVCPNTTFPKFRCARRVSSVLCLHRYRAPETSATVTRRRSQSVLPSQTTFTVSMSNPPLRHTFGASLFEHVTPETIVIWFAKVILPFVVAAWILWHIIIRIKLWRDAVSGSSTRERVVLYSNASEDDEENSTGDGTPSRGAAVHVAMTRCGDDSVPTAEAPSIQ